MKIPLPWCLVVCFLAGLLTGCDPVRTTSQFIDLRVTDVMTEQPLIATKVEMKYDYHAAEPKSERTPYWLKTYSGITNDRGDASVNITFGAIDRSLGSRPPTSRDWITNHPYIINIGEGGRREEFHMVLKPGASTKGKRFMISVLAIHEPQYVQPEQ